MAGDFFPRRDAEFVRWSAALRQRLVDSPDGFGIGQELVNQYAALDDVLQAAYLTAAAPITRTKLTLIAKDDARAAVERAARVVSGLIKAGATLNGVSPADLVGLGFNPRGPGGRNPATRRPASAPDVLVDVTGPRTVEVRLIDSEATGRRGRPKAAAIAHLFTFEGDEPPAKLDGWRFRRATVEMTSTITFGADLPPATRVWVIARWANRRGQPGPLSRPKDVYLIGNAGSTGSPKCVPRVAA